MPHPKMSQAIPLRARRPSRNGRETFSTLFVVAENLIGYAVAEKSQLAAQGPRELPRISKTPELTAEKFASFLAWLSPDAERAGEEYERLRFRLCTFFSVRRCGFADELADETINRVILKSSDEEIKNKTAYCFGVAKNVYLEALRKAQPVDLDEVELAAKAPEERSFSHDCLDKCLNELPAENRTLILEYFSEARQAKIDLHRRISEGLETTQTALRMRVMRIKQKLKICVEECMT